MKLLYQIFDKKRGKILVLVLLLIIKTYLNYWKLDKHKFLVFFWKIGGGTEVCSYMV